MKSKSDQILFLFLFFFILHVYISTETYLSFGDSHGTDSAWSIDGTGLSILA